MNKVNRKFKVVGMGEILWDLLPGGKQLGGAPANFAYHARLLGANGYVVSAVGNDPLGNEIMDTIRKIDLTGEFVEIDQDHPTGTVQVILDTKGHPDYVIHTDVAWDFIPFSGKLDALAKETSAVCFGSLAQRSITSGNTILSFLKATSETCLKIFDINLRQRFYNEKIIKNSLKISNCLKLNEEELPQVAKMCSVNGVEDDILKYLLKEYELDLIALTKGEKGSRLFCADYDRFMASPSVEVADTVGAGDSFTAALALGLLQKLPYETIHRNATTLAAYVCTQKGATPNLTGRIRKELKL